MSKFIFEFRKEPYFKIILTHNGSFINTFYIRDDGSEQITIPGYGIFFTPTNPTEYIINGLCKIIVLDTENAEAFKFIPENKTKGFIEYFINEKTEDNLPALDIIQTKNGNEIPKLKKVYIIEKTIDPLVLKHLLLNDTVKKLAHIESSVWDAITALKTPIIVVALVIGVLYIATKVFGYFGG